MIARIKIWAGNISDCISNMKMYISNRIVV